MYECNYTQNVDIKFTLPMNFWKLNAKYGNYKKVTHLSCYRTLGSVIVEFSNNHSICFKKFQNQRIIRFGFLE
jgi:hypothetical protein